MSVEYKTKPLKNSSSFIIGRCREIPELKISFFLTKHFNNEDCSGEKNLGFETPNRTLWPILIFIAHKVRMAQCVHKVLLNVQTRFPPYSAHTVRGEKRVWKT